MILSQVRAPIFTVCFSQKKVVTNDYIPGPWWRAGTIYKMCHVMYLAGIVFCFARKRKRKKWYIIRSVHTYAHASMNASIPCSHVQYTTTFSYFVSPGSSSSLFFLMYSRYGWYCISRSVGSRTDSDGGTATKRKRKRRQSEINNFTQPFTDPQGTHRT